MLHKLYVIHTIYKSEMQIINTWENQQIYNHNLIKGTLWMTCTLFTTQINLIFMYNADVLLA